MVIPFYAYAALSFLTACILIFFNTAAFTRHAFNPPTLAITHTLALGWGTMIILGAGHQLYPVLVEGKLRSSFLATVSFVLAAIGIPFLVVAFYTFNMGWPMETGGVLINLAVVAFVINLALSSSESGKTNVHATFAFTASLWLLLTTLLGLVLVYNFTGSILERDSLHYLTLHAHLGIAGWFLLMVIGVGTRLIPMFLISKYENPKLLWLVYYLLNGALLLFVILFVTEWGGRFYFFPIAFILGGIAITAVYIRNAYRARIRRKTDNQVRLSILAVALLFIPVLVLIAMLTAFPERDQIQIILLYGFTIFLGWITAIVFGMTFKTLPFIIWNKVYHHRAGLGKTPNPKDLFSSKIFALNAGSYIAGFIIFGTGIATGSALLLNGGAALLVLTAFFYNLNVFKILFHKPNEGI